MNKEKEQESGTFIVKIMNKQNGTWQGSVNWIEGQKTLHFRSALELIKLLDEAAGTGEAEE